MIRCLRLRPNFQSQASTPKLRNYVNYRDFIGRIEQENPRILTAVRNRINERERLIKEVNLSSGSISGRDIQLAKQVKDSESLQVAWDEWTSALQSLHETTPLLTDSDPIMRSLAVEEYEMLTTTMSNLLKFVFPSLLVPPSSTAHLSSLVEIKSGVGGLESSLFVADLMRMYLRFANATKRNAQIISSTDSSDGGIKDVIIEIKGKGSYDDLKFETGVHRVQRVPATEASGRVHTSTVAVLVMPLAEDSNSKRDDELFSLEDVKVEVMRARGAGGQHVNTTESAVRLTHIPTGITVSMQDERSQHQNKRRAFQVLTARLMDLKITRDIEERRSSRRKLVGAVDRSEKIRTYNYPQDRVTDHRIGLRLKNLTTIMEGDGLQELIEALKHKQMESFVEELSGE